MPKRLPGGKVKRGTKPARARVPQSRSSTAADAEVSQSAIPAVPSEARRTAPTPARQSLLSTVRRPAQKAGPTLATDYRYVVSDLKRISVVSAGALVVLIALSFVLH